MEEGNRPHGIVDCAKKDKMGGYDAARTDVLRSLVHAIPPIQTLYPGGMGEMAWLDDINEQAGHAPRRLSGRGDTREV